MKVVLTPRSEELLQELAHLAPPERVIEMALELFATDREAAERRIAAREAVDRIRELRKGNTLGGLSVKDLINEGRKY